jgi:hypothetical protein
MSDERTHYAPKKTIERVVFLGREIGQPNTVSKEEHEGYQRLVDLTINAFCTVKKTDPLLDDDYGRLELIATALYQQIIDNGGTPPELTESQEKQLVDEGYVTGDGGAILHIEDPTNYG